MTTLYVAMESELLLIRGRQGNWHAELLLAGLPTQCLASDPLLPERVYCGTFGRGLWRSADDGAVWQQVDTWPGPAEVTAVAVSRAAGAGDHGVLWVGTEPSLVYRSDDGGQTWHEQQGLRDLPSRPSWSFPPRPWTHHVRWLAPDPVAPERLYVSIEAGGVVRTVDGGRTWEDRRASTPRDVHTLRTHRLAPGRLYAAAGDGYAESHDAGETWQHLEVELRQHYLWSVAVDPADPDTVVVTAASGPRQAHSPDYAESTVYRRDIGGVWQAAAAGLPTPRGTLRPVLATSEAEPGTFYLASNRGVFRSADAGLSWQQLAIPWPERFLRQSVNGLAIS